MASQFGFVSNDDFIEKMDELIDALPHSGATGEVTGVKGNAESAYRVGNVNLTPANIGLGNVNNTSDANKPISTATQTALNNKVSKTGDSMSGPLTHNGAGTVLKSTNLDVNGDNPTSNTWSNTPIEYHDKDNARMGFVNVQRRTDGSTMLEIGAQARNTADTADIYNVIDMLIGRDGTRSYAVTDHAAFRTAILAASKDQVNYNTNNGVKNLLKVDIPEKTVVGLTFTPQSDGTIIVNGTSTTTQTYVVYFNLENPSKTTTNTQHSENKIGYGDFTISLNGEEAYTPGIYLQILCYDSITTNPTVTAQVAYGESKSVMIDTDKKYVWFRLLINAQTKDTTYDNYVLKPMIRDATIEDSTFEPYAKSNAELTSGKLDVTGNESTPYDNLPDHFELWTSPGPATSNGNLWIKMRSYSTSVDSFILLGNDDTLQYFGIEKDNFVVQTKDANSMYEFKDDGIYLNGTRIAP